MIEIKVGTVVKPDSIKCGESKNGAWAFSKVVAEKGYDTITVWFSNPSDFSDGNCYKVAKIESVKKSARKYTDKSGAEKWADEYSVTAYMELVDGESPEGFASLKEDLPF